MLDWLASKVAMTLAALLLLAGVTGFFLAQRGMVVQDALQGIADGVASYVDEVSSVAGEMTTSLSVGASAGDKGFALPARAAGNPYVLVLFATHVVADDGVHRAMAGLTEPIHLWKPSAGPYTARDVAAMDAGHPSLALGGTITIARRVIEVDGAGGPATFAFP